MKRLLASFAAVTAILAAVSCSKDYLSPEELFKDSSKQVRTTITTKSGEEIGTVATFRDIAVYRNSDVEGQSWFCAFSGGRMVYDMFMLSIYFNSIDRMEIGDTLKASRSIFSFIASSDSNATTYSYNGTITLADKGDDYVILHFNKVRFSCSMGEYLTDGYLYCPLFDKSSY